MITMSYPIPFKGEPGKHLINDERQWQAIADLLELSQRELQVCQGLFEGRTRKDIAIQLEIKDRTVRQYMEQLHSKLKVCNRVSLVLRVVQARDHVIKEQALAGECGDNNNRLQPIDHSSELRNLGNPSDVSRNTSLNSREF